MTTFATTATITCARNKMDNTPKAHITFQTAEFYVGGLSYDYANPGDYTQIRQLTKLFGKDFLEELAGVDIRIIARPFESNPMCVDALAVGHPTANVFYQRTGDGSSLTYEEVLKSLQ